MRSLGWAVVGEKNAFIQLWCVLRWSDDRWDVVVERVCFVAYCAFAADILYITKNQRLRRLEMQKRCGFWLASSCGEFPDQLIAAEQAFLCLDLHLARVEVMTFSSFGFLELLIGWETGYVTNAECCHPRDIAIWLP